MNNKSAHQIIEDHKKKIDRQILEHINKDLSDGLIKEDDFYLDKNDKMFKFNDQDGVEVIFNYSKKTVHSYGGNMNN